LVSQYLLAQHMLAFIHSRGAVFVIIVPCLQPLVQARRAEALPGFRTASPLHRKETPGLKRPGVRGGCSTRASAADHGGRAALHGPRWILFLPCHSERPRGSPAPSLRRGWRLSGSRGIPKYLANDSAPCRCREFSRTPLACNALPYR
jgi:hypothetical protein